jgi:aspartyl-tRNA(Asn)/glutamyl-tRNA(Gln) amidotransferase subunit B
VANLICNDLFAVIHPTDVIAGRLDSSQDEDPRKASAPPIAPAQLAEVVSMLLEETISTSMAKKLVSSIVASNATAASSLSPRRLAEERGWQLVADREALSRICRRVLQDHPQQTAEYYDNDGGSDDARQQNKNRQRLTKLFMGKAMAASGGNAHPERLQEVLRDVLDERR